MKPSGLTGPILNWAVGHALGQHYNIVDGVPVTGKTVYTSEGLGYDEVWEPSVSWGQGGPIIEKEFIAVFSVETRPFEGQWAAKIERHMQQQKDEGGDFVYSFYECPLHYGPTPLIAAMRCLVASKLGEEVEVPEELT